MTEQTSFNTNFNEEAIELAKQKREDIKKFHYSNKEQVERMSLFNKTLEFVLLEIEKDISNFDNWEESFEKWWKRLFLKMIEKEKGWKTEYFNEKRS